MFTNKLFNHTKCKKSGPKQIGSHTNKHKLVKKCNPIVSLALVLAMSIAMVLPVFASGLDDWLTYTEQYRDQYKWYVTTRQSFQNTKSLYVLNYEGDNLCLIQDDVHNGYQAYHLYGSGGNRINGTMHINYSSDTDQCGGFTSWNMLLSGSTDSGSVEITGGNIPIFASATAGLNYSKTGEGLELCDNFNDVVGSEWDSSFPTVKDVKFLLDNKGDSSDIITQFTFSVDDDVIANIDEYYVGIDTSYKCNMWDINKGFYAVALVNPALAIAKHNISISCSTDFIPTYGNTSGCTSYPLGSALLEGNSVTMRLEPTTLYDSLRDTLSISFNYPDSGTVIDKSKYIDDAHIFGKSASFGLKVGDVWSTPVPLINQLGVKVGLDNRFISFHIYLYRINDKGGILKGNYSTLLYDLERNKLSVSNPSRTESSAPGLVDDDDTSLLPLDPPSSTEESSTEVSGTGNIIINNSQSQSQSIGGGSGGSGSGGSGTSIFQPVFDFVSQFLGGLLTALTSVLDKFFSLVDSLLTGIYKLIDSMLGGFGMLSEGGLLDLMGKLFSWIPTDVWTLITTGFSVGVIVFVIKTFRGGGK